MRRAMIVAALVLAFCFGPLGASAASYDHEVKGKNISFAWKIDGTTLNGKISAKTDGWVAVGFNPSDKMKDANIVIGYVKNGRVTLDDQFGDKMTGHSADKDLGGTNDVTLVSGTEEGGMTTIEFTMPMDSGDKYDRVLTADADTTLLLAYGPDRDSLRPHHQWRGAKIVNLSTGAEK